MINEFTIERVSMDSSGVAGNSPSSLGAISADGRFVAFSSSASNLVAGDTNAIADIFVHDRQSGITERISVNSSGVQAEGQAVVPWHDVSSGPSISADGRYVAFASYASNLVAGDTNAQRDIFVRDRQTGVTERVSNANNGDQANSDTTDSASISADGRFVAFASWASNLVAGDTNGKADIFVHDRQTGSTERVSIASNGSQSSRDSFGAEISADGRFVLFVTNASNLVAGDTNAASDLFVHDRQTGTTERVSLASGAIQSNGDSDFGSISANGRFIAFGSVADNLVPGDTNAAGDDFVHDRQTGVTERVSVASNGDQANFFSFGTSISVDGRFVAFVSGASNLVEADTNPGTDIFLHDRQTGVTERISVGNNGVGGSSSSSVISADGRFIAFDSDATNLVPGDTNGARDVFIVANPLFDGTVPADLIDVYRFYNAGTGTHFYTGSEAEKDQIVANPGNDPFLAKMVFEGPAYKAFGQDGAEATELYRFYNTATGAHFFTASEGEKNHIVANPANDPFLAAMTLEGVAYYVLGQDGAHAIDVWRFYNGATGVHFYTASESEKDHIVANPGNDPYLTHLVLEGVGFWVPDETWT